MASAQDISDFKAAIPEFADTPDPEIGLALDESDMWLDESMWFAKDFPYARRWLAAHHLKLAAGYTVPTSTGGTGGGSADLYVRMVAFGERRVMFGERKVSQTEGQRVGAGEGMFEDTVYGQKFLRLRARNFPGIVTVGYVGCR